MERCHFLEYKYVVVYDLKLAHFLGVEELEWEKTEKFLDSVSPLAKSMGITICIENLYDGIGGHIVPAVILH